MQYWQINFTKPGLMGYAEYTSNGTLSRYTDGNGVTITPIYDSVFIVSPNPWPKPWFVSGMTYQQVSFLTGTTPGYQITDDSGSITLTDINGVTQTPAMLQQSGLTEIHVLNQYPPIPSWGTSN